MSGRMFTYTWAHACPYTRPDMILFQMQMPEDSDGAADVDVVATAMADREAAAQVMAEDLLSIFNFMYT